MIDRMRQSNPPGTTLVEIILYMGMLVILVTILLTFNIDIAETSQKSRSYQEVQQNARLGLYRILAEIRSAKDLNAGSSTFGSHPGVLSLQHRTPASDPTVFDLSGTTVQIAQGATGPFALTSSRVNVTNLVFDDLSVTNRTTVIRVTLTVQHINADVQGYFDAAITVRGTGVIRVKER